MMNAASLPEDQKIFSTKELKEKGFSQYKVSKLVDEGMLIKLNKRYYENAEYSGEESDFYYTEAYAPKGVICLLSAAAYYHLTTFIPEVVDVAIPRKAKISTIPEQPQLNIHYYTDARYELGITTVREGKNEFQIYDIEKTVVDIVFYKEKVGIKETKEVLVTYLQRKERNLDRLLKYAGLMKCDKTMRQYLEVLV
jgi:predicted transcriptional regulator of viral defense system